MESVAELTHVGRSNLAAPWPIQCLIRRTAHHLMAHAWEMEDGDLTS